MIPLSRPFRGPNDLDAIARVLDSGRLVVGPEVEAFERMLASATARKHAIAVSSGTDALVLALAALDVQGEVLCPALTWPSPAHAIRMRGGTVRLVDVDRGTWNASADGYRSARTAATRAAIVIDQFGNPSEHDAIKEALSGIPIIVDAACALGSTYRGKPNASYGTIACLSFHPRKIVTTGEGGACVTDDDAIADRLRMLRNHGQTRPGTFVEASGNSRLSEVAAALGRTQLGELDRLVSRRREIARRYRSALGARVGMQRELEGAASNFQTFGILLPRTTVSGKRDRILEAMRSAGIECGILSYALSRLHSVGANEPCPNAEAIADQGMALPLFHDLSDGDAARVTSVLEGLL
jgi:perosamine synthetase